MITQDYEEKVNRFFPERSSKRRKLEYRNEKNQDFCKDDDNTLLPFIDTPTIDYNGEITLLKQKKWRITEGKSTITTPV